METTTTTKTTSGFTSGLSMSVTSRYAGMIEESFYKRTRNALFQLFSFLYSDCKPMLTMHSIVSFFRILQFIGPALFCSFTSIWPNNTISSTIINFISVFFHIVPPTVRDESYIIVLSIYIALIGAFFVFLGISSFYYKQYASLPDFVNPVIYVFLNTFGYLLHPIAFQLSGELLGKAIMGEANTSNATVIVLVALVIIMYLGYTWLIKTVVTTTILFNPCSLITVLGSPQLLIFVMTSVITFVLGIASQLNKIGIYVLTGVAFLLYIGAIFIPFTDGGFININHSVMLLGSSMFGAIACIGCIVFTVLDTKGSEVVIFVLAALWAVTFMLAYLFLNNQRKNSLRILDYIEDDKENFEIVKSPHQLANIIVTGFTATHPLCISKDIFQLAIDKWQEDVNVWVIYAKFIAIYPEEMQKLGWIQHQMMQLKLKGATSKHVQEEILRLLRTRESNISPELKKKLNKINKKVQLVKHKLRHIWDLVIQGNIGDIGSFIEKTYDAVEETEAEFNHIISQFPNSRFVARTYARFCLEIKADHQSCNEWTEKAKMLQLGMQVAKDHAHDLGLTYFQGLPTGTSKIVDSVTGNQDSESQILDIDGYSDERNQMQIEQAISLREQINELRIPSITLTKIGRVLVLSIAFLLPLIIATALIYTFSSSFSEPMNYLVHVSMLRTYIFASAAYSMRYANEKLGYMPKREDVIRDFNDNPPESLGGTWDVGGQLSYFLNELTSSLEELKGLRSVAKGNDKMDQARAALFENNINYTLYVSETSTKYETTSVSVASMEIVSQLSNLLKEDTATLTSDIFKTSYIANPTKNSKILANSISYSLTNITNYMKANNDSVKHVMLIIDITLSIALPIILIIVVITEISTTNKNNRLIFKCLTSLPKNIVSSVADSLKMMKSDQSESMSHTDDSEMNKQEENMLKIFATASDTSGKIDDSLLQIVCTLFSVGLVIAIMNVIYIMFTNMSSSIYDAAPSIDNLMGAYSYQIHMILDLMIIASNNKGDNVLGSDTEELLTDSYDSMEESLTYFENARFGKSDGSEAPFEELNAGILRQNELTACKNSDIKQPETFADSYKCLSLELLFYLSENFLNMMIEPQKQNDEKFLPDNDILWNLWEIETMYMYARFFHPIFSDIVPSVEETLLSDVAKYLIIAYMLFLAEIIIEIITIRDSIQEERHMRFALSLLLHCPPSTVTQIPLITNVISGNFTMSKGDAATRNKQYFDEVLGHFPDPLIITDESGSIVQVNKAAKNMFDSMELIGIKILDFFNNKAFQGTVIAMKKQAPQEEDVEFTDAANTKFNLNIKSLSFNQMTAYTFRDITQTVRYNTLIDEERAKSDKLLESILPAKLVRRVQQGEKNISFSVQSASIVFMDIVSFTPWCGSNPASFVMETLNKLYKEFDALVAKYPTMTRIKCIGDCYMAAGGIFSEINQPAVHAKEIVQFGLDAIQALGPLNKETNQSLQIRVGINTGGPIVAGVLGSGKPTFEILGPAINMAQQMEHNGVPMQVHISRAVYELIYGGSFKIKERGQIEIKNGTVVTYLVTG